MGYARKNGPPTLFDVEQEFPSLKAKITGQMQGNSLVISMKFNDMKELLVDKEFIRMAVHDSASDAEIQATTASIDAYEKSMKKRLKL